MRKNFIILFFLLLLNSCVGSSTSGVFGTGVSVALDPRTLGTQIDDSIMQKNLRARLVLTEKKYFVKISVKVLDGRIFLGGKVDEPEEKLRITKMAWETKGSRSVKNNIVVKQKFSFKNTVKDILIMSNYLIKNYPKYYIYFKETSFTWNRTGGDPITQGNRNTLLYENIGVDGLKTGFLTVEKYSLASSILRNGRRLIAVGSGFQSKRSRVNESKKLLTYGLTNFDTIEISKKNEKFLSLDTWFGKKEKVDIYVNGDVYITVPKRKKNTISAYIQYNGPIPAPVEKDVKLGVLNIFLNNELFAQHDVFSMEKIKKINIFSRIIKSLNFLVWGDV